MIPCRGTQVRETSRVCPASTSVVRRGRLFAFAVAAVFSLSGTFCVADDKPDRNQILVGMQARREAVQTGTFHYKYGSIFTDPEKPSPWPWNSKDPHEPRELEITVAGTEWVIRYPNYAIINMHRDKFDAAFNEETKDNVKQAGLVLEGASETIEEESKDDMKFRLLQAGTVPWQPLWDYLVDHWDNSSDKGSEVVDGEKCRVLEWSVPGTDFKYLQNYSADLSIHVGMLLRMYVVPDKGFVLKQLDYCTPEGRMTTRFESRDLRPVAAGIWYPWGYYYIRNHIPRKMGYSVEQFTVLEIKGVNEPVPESAFEIYLPAGTTVWDNRLDRHSTRFVTDGSTPLSKVDDAIRAAAKGPTAAPGSPWRKALIAFNMCVAAVLLVVAWFKRRSLFPEP
jgi:hypothetical protein